MKVETVKVAQRFYDVDVFGFTKRARPIRIGIVWLQP